MKITAHTIDWCHEDTDLALLEHGTIRVRGLVVTTLYKKNTRRAYAPRAGGGGGGATGATANAPEEEGPDTCGLLALQDIERSLPGLTAHVDDDEDVANDVVEGSAADEKMILLPRSKLW